MFGFFSKKVEKREFEQLKEAVQTGFNSAKQDVNSLTKWVKHLTSEDSELKYEISKLNKEITSIKDDMENLKESIFDAKKSQMFKQRQTVFNKQTAVQGVLNSVQTGVQTVFLDNLSTTERAIIFVLLNSEMKLSYDDLAAMLGKSKATIRGQINNIKQKSEGLVEEIIGKNNKKRVFISEKTKEILFKTRKVRTNKKVDKEENEVNNS